MKQKITDTSAEISAGGRLKRHWQGKTPKQKRSFFVSFKEEEFDMKAILNEFSLKGFEFGRWVNNEDRYDFVIGTKESMEDLSKLLKSKKTLASTIISESLSEPVDKAAMHWHITNQSTT